MSIEKQKEVLDKVFSRIQEIAIEACGEDAEFQARSAESKQKLFAEFKTILELRFAQLVHVSVAELTEYMKGPAVSKWIRYRIHTPKKGRGDNAYFEPKKEDPRYPYWYSGYTGCGGYAVVIMWLPEGEKINNWWKVYGEVEKDEPCDSIRFSDRFSKPYGFIES